VRDFLASHGASFYTDIVEATKLLGAQVELSLGELVANGLVVSDSFAGLRALLTPSNRKTRAASTRKHRQPVYTMATAGRWSLLKRESETHAASESNKNGLLRTERMTWSGTDDLEAATAVAWILLKRYGVVFKRLLERERMVLPWRVLLRIYHRLEARGEIRGGRFVSGISGEQFALPEAVGMMRAIRRTGPESSEYGFRFLARESEDSSPISSTDEKSLISVSAADPLNLLGTITPGKRVAGHSSNRILYRDGAPIAVLESGETRFLVELSRSMEWKAKNALMRIASQPQVRSYTRRQA
jgi:ATP-dependent Lhr-like helicase